MRCICHMKDRMLTNPYIESDDISSNKDTNALDQVPQHMYEGCPDIDVGGIC